MTKEEKQLLLVDLCARLPFEVKVQYLTGGDKTYICNVDQISIKSQCVGIAEIGHTIFTWRTIDRIKPYLRPMSSMTEEEKHELLKFGVVNLDKGNNAIDVCCVGFENHAKVQNYLNSIHVDYRGLIEKGLALEAIEGMYKK